MMDVITYPSIYSTRTDTVFSWFAIASFDTEYKFMRYEY